MFKSWRSEMQKIKAVFKLQFQATQVPQLKKPTLIISLVPEDVGKTTFKLEKAAVHDGICTWENPIYVTVKLIKEPKTGKLHEKIYHFLVSSGSSKSGYLGESSVDFADFAKETEPITVSLPLKFANSGAVLNVAIQKIQGGGGDQSFIEHNGDLTLLDRSLKSHLSNDHTNGTKVDFAENTEQDDNFNGSIDSDASIHSIVRQNSPPHKGIDNTNTAKNGLHRRSSTGWSMGSASYGSLIDSTNSPEDIPRELQQASEGSIEKFKSEISNLMRQLDISELELQSLRKQIMKESRRAQDLSRQVIDLQEERDALKTECEQLKSAQRCFEGEAVAKLRVQNEETRLQLEETWLELSQKKELNSNLHLQLKKTQNSNSELILAVQDLDEMLKQKNMEISSLSNKLELRKNANATKEKQCNYNVKEDEDQRAQAALEDLAGEKNDATEFHLLHQKIKDLADEIEVYREDREKLEKYMEQLTQDYKDLKQENLNLSSELEQKQHQELKAQNETSESLATIEELESQVQRLEDKLRKQTQEVAEYLISINEFESRVKRLEKELEKQAQDFEKDLDAMTIAKIKQEQRAIHAEEALRKTMWKNTITAERLQKEFKRLSVEMAVKLDENEKLTMNALAEANEVGEQKRILEERLQKYNEVIALIQEQNRVKVEELSTQLNLSIRRMEKMSLELEDKSNQLRDAQKQGEEKQEAFLMDIQMLKAKIEMLTTEKNGIPEQVEQVKLRNAAEDPETAYEETKMLVERRNKERDELERKFASTEKEAEKAQEELIILRSLEDEKETMVEHLLSEVESLKVQHMELKNSYLEEESEKENLSKQILQLKDLLQWKEEGSIRTEVRKDNGQATFADEKKSTERGDTGRSLLNYEASTSESNPVEKQVKVLQIERDEATHSEQEQKVSSFYSSDYCKFSELLTQIEQLKERNKSMENELKEMQERYSDISLKFAVVEGERQQLVMTVRNLRNGKKN